MDRGADVDATGNDGVTALLLASRRGHSLVVKALLDGGADPNLANSIGQRPLHFAPLTIGEASEEITIDLLTAGAEIDATDGSGDTPLNWAVFVGNIGVTRVLVDQGADKTIAGDDGDGPLDQICQCLENAGIEGTIQCPVGGCEEEGTTEEINNILM